MKTEKINEAWRQVMHVHQNLGIDGEGEIFFGEDEEKMSEVIYGEIQSRLTAVIEILSGYTSEDVDKEEPEIPEDILKALDIEEKSHG